MLKSKSNEGTLIQIEADQITFMRNLRFKPFFIALAAATIETTIGKRCDAQTVGFSPEIAKANSLVELVARWEPVVETLLALVTAGENAKEFSSKLSDDNFVPNLSRQINALLHAMGSAKQHAAFAELVTGT